MSLVLSQLVRISRFHQPGVFLCIQVRDIFQQAIWQHAENFVQQPDEEEMGEQGLPLRGSTGTRHQCLFPK